MIIKIMQIDYRQPLQPIYVDSKYGWLFVVVCWGYRPLGMLRFQCPAHTRVVSTEQLRHEILQSFGWWLWEAKQSGVLDHLTDQPGDAAGALPPISVVVCTRDRALSLQRCLQALQQVDYPDYEVIVVDNCSRDVRVAEVVAQRGFRYVREDRPGLDWARNRGIQEARHEIIAYMDDDALAAQGWLRGIASAFADREVMAVTGMVLPAELETPAQNDFERYGGMSKGFIGYTIYRDQLDKRARFWSSNWGVGANMAFRRSLFSYIGGFDIALDVGTPTNGAGDIEFFYRTVTAGYPLRYEPAAMAYHVHRRDNRTLERQIYNNGRSFLAYLLTVARNEPQKSQVVFYFALRWWLWPWLLHRLIRSWFNRDQWTAHYTWIELKGALSGWKAYQTAQKIASEQVKEEDNRINFSHRSREVYS
jgi:glycosyltransferase involved in cell wall biosynthesis